MKISIKTEHFPLSDALKNYVERRLRFALSFGDEHISRVLVRLSDVNGPKGGVDKCCQILVTVSGMNNVVVRDIEADMYASIDRASNRAGRTIRRKLARRRYLSLSAGRDFLKMSGETVQ